MFAVVAAGALAGLGLWALTRGLRPPARIEDELARLLGRPLTVTADTAAGPQPGNMPTRWMKSPLATRCRLAADLAVNGRTPEAHSGRCLLAAGALGALATAATTALAASGTPVPGVAVPIAALAAAPAGLALIFVVERADAARRREELRRTLATFLDLSALTLAAGAGVETALINAAEAGEGWTWDRLRDALRPARVTGSSPWAALARLGEDLDVVELIELSSAVALAVSSGGRLRETLAARAAALRTRELAQAQAQAASATERMTFPVVAMAFGFLFLVGFPAVARVLGTS